MCIEKLLNAWYKYTVGRYLAKFGKETVGPFFPG